MSNEESYFAVKIIIIFQMFKDLIRILHNSIQDSTIYVVTLTGTGIFFSIGNDFKYLMNQNDSAFNIESTINIYKEFIDTLITYPKLLIAVVNGPAIGIAVTMLALFDLIYASNTTYFQTPFSKLGLVAEGCSTYTFSNIFGKSKASDMLYLGHKMTALEAKHYGFVNEIYEYENLNKVWTYLQKLTELSSESILATKRLVQRWNQDILLKVNAEETVELVKRLQSPDFLERISIILYKNKL
ncbi:enoyl-CoA delta isomerase 3, peroxisomal isoform X3 [Frieseomelitta varia]|uniref:enoyl-CoA delta isomerase 3, peroxisomal isoform X3 n=1 Tax=Frieseomelitta varia TaxID=561572 RepID=UPI001CB69854|nr:enoyl-CoA delta isomerase 3, peroxisomal isoform X3 [Frieseomelitta varia]